MAPTFILNQHRLDIYVKKLNNAQRTITKLRRNSVLLSNQNKDLSASMNNLLLQKLALEKENNSLKSSNIQMTAMYHSVCKNLNLLESNLNTCVPALVTLSSYIPNMITNVHEMKKLNKLNESQNSGKREKQTKTVRPMVHGMTIRQPAVSIRRLNMSPIVESPTSEQTPRRPRRSSFRISPQNQLNCEPYVRLKDVKVMLKNSKTVPNENSYRQLDDNLGEGPSWLHSPENQMHSSNNNSVTSNFETSLVLNEISTPVMSTTASSENISDQLTEVNETEVNETEVNETKVNETEVHDNIMSPADSSVMRNITCRRRTRRKSSESSIASDIEDSSVSRPRRSGVRAVSYKEPSVSKKLRRN